MRFIWGGWHRYSWRSLLGLAIAFLIGLVLPAISAPSLPHSPTPPLPTPYSHPLPPSLANWRDPKQSGDYFSQVQPIRVGYLIWSQFPVTVYIQPPTALDNANAFLAKRSRTWVMAVQTAVQEWNPYLPLKLVDEAEGADISIWRSTPPLRFERDEKGQSGNRSTLPISRARSAETRFDLYVKQVPLPYNPRELSSSSRAADPLPLPRLFHRVTIYIRPDQPTDYLQATARHELGHAIGIWGHSPNQTDSMYFSQVRNPAKISARDLNTLKRVYEQPTSLGWVISSESFKKDSSTYQRDLDLRLRSPMNHQRQNSAGYQLSASQSLR